MATGTATLAFGTTPAVETTVAVTGQTGIVSESKAEAWFMVRSTATNGTVEHEMASALMPLVCGDIVAGTGFTIRANVVGGLVTGDFTVDWGGDWT